MATPHHPATSAEPLLGIFQPPPASSGTSTVSHLPETGPQSTAQIPSFSHPVIPLPSTTGSSSKALQTTAISSANSVIQLTTGQTLISQTTHSNSSPAKASPSSTAANDSFSKPGSAMKFSGVAMVVGMVVGGVLVLIVVFVVLRQRHRNAMAAHRVSRFEVDLVELEKKNVPMTPPAAHPVSLSAPAYPDASIASFHLSDPRNNAQPQYAPSLPLPYYGQAASRVPSRPAHSADLHSPVAESLAPIAEHPSEDRLDSFERHSSKPETYIRSTFPDLGGAYPPLPKPKISQDRFAGYTLPPPLRSPTAPSRGSDRQHSSKNNFSVVNDFEQFGELAIVRPWHANPARLELDSHMVHDSLTSAREPSKAMNDQGRRMSLGHVRMPRSLNTESSLPYRRGESGWDLDEAYEHSSFVVGMHQSPRRVRAG